MGVLLTGALCVFVGIYATWAYQDDPSSAQNLIFVPFGLVLGAPGWGLGYLAYRVARPDTSKVGSSILGDQTMGGRADGNES